MPIVASSNIFLDANGVAWIANTTTKVIEVVLDQEAFELTPTQIHAEHPHLSLAQVHGALSYYYDHKSELDEEIERRYQLVEQLRSNTGAPITGEQLRKRRRLMLERAAG